MRVRAVAVSSGIAFGFLISWAGLANPDRIRSMLLFEDWYLYPMFVSAVAVGFLGLHAMRGAGFRALVTRDLVTWTTTPLERKHVVGSVIFGLGWAIADACPGPIAAQLGFGQVWSLCTAVGVFAGIALYFQYEDRFTRRDDARSRRRSPARRRGAATARPW
jgi:uncharacterized membrane protein YedE/YeeE